MTTTQQTVINPSYIANIIIGVSIMLLGPFFSSPEFSFPATEKLINLGFPVVDGNVLISFSETGWVAAIIFLGLLWLWVTVDIFWPSLLGMTLIALNPLYSLPGVISGFLGTPTIFLILFLLFFIAALIKSKVIDYVANFLLTRDFLHGKPWMLLAVLMFTTYLCSMISTLSTVLLLWPVVYLILEEIGCKPGDKLSTFMIGNIVGVVVFAVTTDIIKGPLMFMVSGFRSFALQNPQLCLPEIDVIAWLFMTITMSMSGIFLILFSMRFIFKVDVEPLRNFDTKKLKQNPLPPMNWQQKTIVIAFIIYVVWMLLPHVLPAELEITKYLKGKSVLGAFIVFTVFNMIKYKGEPLVKISELAATVPWGLFFLLATTFYFGNQLTNVKTNIPIFLETLVSSSLVGFSYFPFLIFTIFFALICTNIINSVVSAVILAPVIATVAISYGFNAMPIVVLFIYVTGSALLTPASGVLGAVLYGNTTWFPGGKGAVFYSTFFTIIVLIIVFVIGLPLANILF